MSFGFFLTDLDKLLGNSTHAVAESLKLNFAVLNNLLAITFEAFDSKPPALKIVLL